MELVKRKQVHAVSQGIKAATVDIATDSQNNIYVVNNESWETEMASVFISTIQRARSSFMILMEAHLIKLALSAQLLKEWSLAQMIK